MSMTLNNALWWVTFGLLAGLLIFAVAGCDGTPTPAPINAQPITPQQGRFQCGLHAGTLVFCDKFTPIFFYTSTAGDTWTAATPARIEIIESNTPPIALTFHAAKDSREMIFVAALSEATLSHGGGTITLMQEPTGLDQATLAVHSLGQADADLASGGIASFMVSAGQIQGKADGMSGAFQGTFHGAALITCAYLRYKASHSNDLITDATWGSPFCARFKALLPMGAI